MAFSYAGFLE